MKGAFTLLGTSGGGGEFLPLAQARRGSKAGTLGLNPDCRRGAAGRIGTFGLG